MLTDFRLRSSVTFTGRAAVKGAALTTVSRPQYHHRSNIALLRTAARVLGCLSRGTNGRTSESSPSHSLSNPSNIENCINHHSMKVLAHQADTPKEPGQPLWNRLVRTALTYLGILLVVLSLVVSAPSDALARGGHGRGGGGRGHSGGVAGGRSFSRSGRSSSSTSSGSHHTSVHSKGWDVGSSSTSSIASAYGRTNAASATTAVATDDTDPPELKAVRLAIFWLVIVWYWCRPFKLDREMEKCRSDTAEIGVHRIQVALLSSVREELQGALEQLVEEADTSSRAGMHALLQGSLLALLRRSSYFAFGSVYDTKFSTEARADSEFSRFSLQERSRNREPTRQSYGGKKAKQAPQLEQHQSAPEAPEEDELVVVTLLVAARLPGAGVSDGRGSSTDVWGALRRLCAVAEKDVRAVEVLWTPETPGDTLSRLQLLDEYPDLLPL